MIPSGKKQSYCYFEPDENNECDHFVSMKDRFINYKEEDDKNEN